MGEQTIIHDGFFWTATDGNIDAELLERVFTEVLEETEISDDENGFSGTALYGVSAEVIEVLENGRCEVKVIGEDQNFATGDIIAITYSIFEKTDAVYEITPGQIEVVQSLFEELYVDYTTNDDGTYTFKDNNYKYKIEVSGIEGESQVTFIVLTNNTEISFEDISYSLKKAEISTGVPEFIILGWY